MLRFGIMGTGKIAHTMAGAIMRTAGTELYAVGSRNADSAQQFARTYNISRAHGSYEALCADDNVDIVYVATPHGRHYEDASLALAGGKHVLCEKAFTLNANQARALADRARENNLFLCEAMWTRFIPATKKASLWLREGRIGEVRFASAELGFVAAPDFSHRLLNLDLGGGALLDVGVYALAFISYAFGAQKPREVKAGSRFFANGADSMTTALLGYDTGWGSAGCSLDTRMDCRGIICGTRGRIEFHDNFMAPRRVVLHADDAAPEEFTFGFDHSGHEFQIAACAQAIAAGRPECVEMPAGETVLIMDTIDEIKRLTGLKYPQDGV